MTPEELYHSHEKIVYTSLYELIKYPENFCKKKGFTMEDLEQYGRMALWSAALKCKDVKRFPAYAFLVVKGAYKDLIFHMKPYFLIRLPYRNEHEERDEVVSYLSVDKEDEETGYSIKDILPSPSNVEHYVMRKLEFEDKLSQLTEKQATYISEYIQGYTTTEIARKYGLKDQYAVTHVIMKGIRTFDPDFKCSLRANRRSEMV